MAEGWHISADLCRRFLDQRVSKAERRAVVRHLISQCPNCLGLMGRITSESGYWFGPAAAEALAERDYSQAFQAAYKFTDREARRIAFEQLRGWGHWSALDRLLPNERLPAIVMHRDWQHWGLFRAMLDAARWYSFRDPREAVDIVQLALEMVDLLNPADVGGESAANDMRAKASAILGNTRRLASDLEGARQAINTAWRWNEQGTGDPLERAMIYSFDASYSCDIGDFEMAEAILEKALSLYLAAGDTHLQGRTLVKMGVAIGYVDPDKGIAHLQHALELMNPVREPRLELCAQHALAYCLTDAGRPQEALAIMARARALYKQFPDDWAQLRLHWLQGRIARALDQHSEAASILRQVREQYLTREQHIETIMVTIDLAEVLTAAGGIATAARLLAEMTPIMKAWNLHRDNLAAWLMFEKALKERRAAGAAVDTLFVQIRTYYLRHWNRPTAEFSVA